jgi:Protein of unknown function (DUF3093)
LSTPPWWWLPALVIVALVYLDVRLGHPNWPTWLTMVLMVLLVLLVAVALHRLGRARVSVTEDAQGHLVLRVGPATLPIRFITAPSAVATKDKQQTLGPQLDPEAYVLHRPWIGPLVRVTLNDPADPTPYWLFSSRRPEALVECLRTSSRSGRGRGPSPE